MDVALYKALRDRELNAIEANESSHGQFTEHKEAKVGPLKGQQAVGNYALMPGTIEHILKTSNDPALKKYKKMDLDDAVSAIEDDQFLQKKLAESYYDEIYRKHPNDAESRAASWLMGPNRDDAKMHQLMQNFPKVQQYINNFNKNLPGKPELKTPDLNLVPQLPIKPSPLSQNIPIPEMEEDQDSSPVSQINKFQGLHDLMGIANNPTPEVSSLAKQQALEKSYLNPYNELEEDEDEDV